MEGIIVVTDKESGEEIATISEEWVVHVDEENDSLILDSLLDSFDSIAFGLTIDGEFECFYRFRNIMNIKGYRAKYYKITEENYLMRGKIVVFNGLDEVAIINDKWEVEDAISEGLKSMLKTYLEQTYVEKPVFDEDGKLKGIEEVKQESDKDRFHQFQRAVKWELGLNAELVRVKKGGI